MRPQDQLSLFPELDPFKTIIKDIDYVDISTLAEPSPNHSRLHQYNLIPKDKFFLYKTGGINPFRPELGNVFPYLKNEESKKLVSINLSKYYVRASINVFLDEKYISIDIKLHRVVALAFIVNDNPEKKVSVDHINNDRLNYSLENLRWVTNSENNKGLSRPRNECWEAAMVKKGKI